MRFTVVRRLLAIAPLALLLMISRAPRAEDEIFPAMTFSREFEALPVYVITPPSQGKKPSRPLNLPIVPYRKSAPTIVAAASVPFPMSADQALRLGEALMSDADYEAALPYFQKVHNEQAHSFAALIGLAKCYYQLHRDDEGIERYKEVLIQDPTLWDAHFSLGRIYLESARFPEAVPAFKEALRLKPGDPDIMRSLGIALAKLGQNTEAIPYLIQVTALQSSNPEVFYNLAEAYANEKQWEQAAQAFKTGADIRKIFAEPYFNWATMLYNADRLEEAVAAYRHVLKIDVEHAESPVYLAECLKMLGKLGEAQGYYREVLRKKPDDVEALLNLAYLCLKGSQWVEADQIYTKVMGLDPTRADAFSNLAAIRSRDNERFALTQTPTQGITLREAVKVSPDAGEAHVNLGAQLITEKIFPEAVEVLQRAVKLLPNSAAAHFNLGLAQYRVGDHQNAAASYRTALQFKPEWGEGYNNLGRAYDGLKKWDEAAKAYENAIRIIPKYAGARYNLAVTYMQLGRKALALQQVEILRPLSQTLPNRLAYVIYRMEAGGTAEVLATTPGTVASATPTPTPSPVLAEKPEPAAVVTAPPSEPQPAKVENDCPGPIYRPGDVTDMAQITGELQAAYTDEALRNRVEGKVVLQAVLCANGVVSDITVQEGLPFGLTGQAIEAMKKVRFAPARMDAKPVSVMVKQEFVCAQASCIAIRR